VERAGNQQATDTEGGIEVRKPRKGEVSIREFAHQEAKRAARAGDFDMAMALIRMEYGKIIGTLKMRDRRGNAKALQKYEGMVA